MTGVPRGQMSFHYLGMPSTTAKLRVMHYTPLVDKIEQNITAWTHKTLSYAARTDLIRSVIQGVDRYWLFISGFQWQ